MPRYLTSALRLEGAISLAMNLYIFQLFLVLATCILSSLIAYFIIKLYIKRIKGQEENLKKNRLKMETLEGESRDLWFFKITVVGNNLLNTLICSFMYFNRRCERILCKEFYISHNFLTL